MTTDEDAFLNAIAAAPDDDAPKLVFADWLDERGEPGRALALRQHCQGGGQAVIQAEMTGDQFNAGVVGQDDDNDYEESGWVAVVVGDRAYLGRYSHCSCYDTWASLNSGGISDYFASDESKTPTWDWSGTPDELVDMARRTADPSMPWRTATEDDHDFDHLTATYAQVIAWDAKGRPVNEAAPAV